MEYFALNKEFESYAQLKQTKKEYETATNNLLVTVVSHLLKGHGEFKDKMVYERLTWGCKAGKERPSTSKGWRESKTYKKGCPAMVRTQFVNWLWR